MINSRRREERIAVKLEVRVWGMDANGKPFSHTATTLDVTRTGARLNRLPCPLQPGDIIGIQHGNEKARYRVAWIGKFGTTRNGQIGVLCLEPDKYIWGTPLNVLKAAATPEEPRTLGPSFVQPLPTEIAAPKTTGSERRDSTRYACTGGADFRNIEGGFKNWGTVSDLSDTGCYIETIFPLPAKAQIELLISIRNVEIRGRALVRSCHPNVGMGIEFTQLSPEDQQRLQSLISGLSIVPGAAQRSTPANQPTLPTAATPNVTAPVPTLEKQPALSDQLYKACTELRDAEALLESRATELEPKAISELIRAIDHARETTATVQKWLEQHGGRDHFNFIEERENARVRTATALARELTVDVESTCLHLGSEGFEGLASAIAQLHQRLTSLVEKNREKTEAVPPK